MIIYFWQLLQGFPELSGHGTPIKKTHSFSKQTFTLQLSCVCAFVVNNLVLEINLPCMQAL